MKKLGMFLMLMVAMAIAMPSNSYGQYDRMKKKAQKKEYKAKMKQFRKEGWTIYGSSHSLEVALLSHYEGLQEEGAEEIVGVASAFMSKNIGKQAAMNSAINEYARRAQSFVQGRIVSDMFNNADEIPEEFDKFYAAYESMVVKEMQGELKPSFSVIRTKGKDDKGNEIYEMQTYFVVNEAAASKARIRAMEEAMKESELSQKYAEKVSGFVREGFDLED